MNNGDFIIPENVKLLIVPDAGTNDVKQLNVLIDNGVDCICLDHHEKENSDCECKAIIVNNQISNGYSCKSFSGVGIAYEFARALDDYYICAFADKYLDLVAFGNISDVMDVRDLQTRYYIEKGMKNIRNKFLKALDKSQVFSTKGEINIHNISWYWTPICNSMIRIGSLEERDLLFRAFIETDEIFPYKKRGSDIFVDEDIYARAARLCKNIKSRQDKLRNELCDSLIDNVNPDDKVAVIVANDADPGIIGLSCMKVADTIKKPCMVLREFMPNVYGGSCRNYNNSVVKDFKELVNSTKLFSLVAGHSNAFGVEILEENLEDAVLALNEALDNIEVDDTIYCDFLLWADDIDSSFVKAIDDSKWLYGTGIEEPTVVIEGICIDVSDCCIMGSNHDSICFMYNGIKFCKFKCSKNDELLAFVNEGDGMIYMNVVVKCSINEYNGTSTAQAIIENYEIY